MTARHPASGAKTQDGAHAQRGADARNSSLHSRWHPHHYFSVADMFAFLIITIFFTVPMIIAGIIRLSN